MIPSRLLIHTLFLGIATLWCAPSAARSQEQDPLAMLAANGAAGEPRTIARNRIISLMPEDKRALMLKGDERNPFARRNPDVDLITEESDQETEADLIRDILNALPVSGRSMGPNGLRVLAGGIVFERGKMVDQVIPNQTENLIVENVNEASIELAWIDMETGKLTGKRLNLTYDLSAKVRYVLKGQNALLAGDGSNPTPPQMGVLTRRVETPTADQIAADKLPNNISVEAFSEGQ